MRLVAGIVCLWIGGCAHLHRGPAADEVVSARQLSLQAQQFSAVGRWQEAESLFAKAIETCPVDERSHHRFAQALWQQGTTDLSLTHMQRAVHLSGGDPGLLVELGQMHLELGQIEQADRCSLLARETNAQLSSAWVLAGDVERHRGHRDAALAHYHRALSVDPQIAAAQLAVADLYLQQQRPRRALSTLDNLARQFTPGSEPTRLLWLQGLAYRGLNRPHDAVAKLTAAADRASDNPQLLLDLAEAQLSTGDVHSAGMVTQRARQLSPDATALARIEDQLARTRASLTRHR